MPEIETEEVETNISPRGEAVPEARPALPKALAAFQYHNYQLWFGGHANLTHGEVHPHEPIAWDDRPQSIQAYIPARTALVLAPAEFATGR